MLITKGSLASCLPPASISPDIVKPFTARHATRPPRAAMFLSTIWLTAIAGGGASALGRGAFAAGAAFVPGPALAARAASAARAGVAAIVARRHRIETIRFMVHDSLGG